LFNSIFNKVADLEYNIKALNNSKNKGSLPERYQRKIKFAVQSSEQNLKIKPLKDSRFKTSY
jgi:hypothetical protein